jgi:3-deoxy-manno-octulosonate cytidylyltransferase (CMP-KDO synthetase)
VATDDERIAAVARQAGYRAVLTSEDNLTGTDRVAEAASQVDADVYLNIQGDEPVLDVEDVRSVLEAKLERPHWIANGFCYLSESEDPASPHIPKVVTTESGRLVYMSRAALPASKDRALAPSVYKKQVCIYAYSYQELAEFKAFGRKGSLESYEDIEILRFLELGREVFMVETQGDSVAVDIPEDVGRAEQRLRALGRDACD